MLPLPGEMATQKAREIIAFYIGGLGAYYKELLTGFGFGDACEQVDALYSSRETRRQAAAAVPDGMLEALMIAGDPDFCVAELERRRSFGVDLPILNLPNDMPWQMVEMFIRLMAPKTAAAVAY